MKARRTGIIVDYNGKDISKNIEQYMTGFSVSEVMSGEGNKADIALEDREEMWMGDWFPQRGDTLEISMIQTNWDGEGSRQSIKLGKMEIDEIENSGPPNTAKIGAVSIPNNAEIRSVEKTRSWEKVKLSVIAKDIADGAGMESYYEAQEDPVLDRAEESGQTDLEFLMKLCKDAGLALNVFDKKIVIFDEQKYEDAEPVMTITKGKSPVKSFNFKSTIHNIYKACHVKYKDSKGNVLIEHTFTDPNKKDGMTLEINEKVEDQAAAEKLAKKKLREKNKEEVKASMTMPGNFNLVAGNAIKISGFHVYDGKYIIEKATHDLGSGGYTVSMDIRKCLNGY